MKYLVALMILIAQPAQARWVLAETSSDHTEHYIDFMSIRVDGNYRKFWKLINFPKIENSTGQESIRVRMEIDCKEERQRILTSTRFSKPMEAGSILNNSTEISEWQDIAPTSVANTFLTILCPSSKP